jgi:hypothetical protein
MLIRSSTVPYMFLPYFPPFFLLAPHRTARLKQMGIEGGPPMSALIVSA